MTYENILINADNSNHDNQPPKYQNALGQSYYWRITPVFEVSRKKDKQTRVVILLEAAKKAFVAEQILLNSQLLLKKECN
jgi:hypothetical protein